LSNHFALNLEVNANMLSDGFNSKNGGSVDWQFNGLAGVVYTFGGRYTKTQIIQVVEEVDEDVEEILVETEPAEPVEEKIEPAPVQAPVKKSIQECVFFLINSSVIRQEEMPKIEELAEFLKNNPDCDVTIAGYADKMTGTEKYNLYLSKQRANSVAEALIGMGIAEDRIVIDAYGDTVQPFEQNNLNRVAIAISSNNSK
ncbi:MAG: OmpA family protein, partial [Muribaculaceae bacterium]|nr:OmpA family protein [Muribaculaceae bacterium]